MTLKGIADKLGVTPATISKALRGSSDISDDMKDKVKALANELGYRPNILARTLKNRRSYLLGVIIPDLRISFYSEVTRGIYEQSRIRGYVAILMVNDEKPENERTNLEFLYDLHVDGILIDPAPGRMNYDLYQRLVNAGFPIVSYDRKLAKFGFSCVAIDDCQASLKLVSEIIKQGRKRILLLGPTKGISVAVERYQGYQNALKQANIDFNPELVVQCDLHAEDSYNKMKKVLANGIHPDAVVCIGGLVAYGAGNAIRDAGLSVPDDVILAEFGDNNIVTRLGIPFITVNQNPYKIGQLAVDVLVDEIENEQSQTKHILVETELLNR